LIVAAEIAFWVVLAAGLGARYLLRMPRLSTALLLGVPLIDVLLLTATVLDLRNGGEPSHAHGLAALYLGFTVAYGHTVIAWADGHAAHRLGRGPKPPKAPKGGWARARHEWRLWSLTLLAVAIGCAVLQGMIWGIGDADRTEPLVNWQLSALRVLGIHLIIALCYTIWRGEERPDAERSTTARSTGEPSRMAERSGQNY
jgi:hypothetical protein